MNRSLVPIKLEARWLLIESSLVREILGAESWLPIPRAVPELPGIVAWRGRAVPVFDLGRALGASGLAPRQARARTLIVEQDASVLAVPVDGAREVRTIAEQMLHRAHSTALPYADTEVDTGDIVMPVLDLSALIREVAERAIQAAHPAQRA